MMSSGVISLWGESEAARETFGRAREDLAQDADEVAS